VEEGGKVLLDLPARVRDLKGTAAYCSAGRALDQGPSERLKREVTRMPPFDSEVWLEADE